MIKEQRLYQFQFYVLITVTVNVTLSMYSFIENCSPMPRDALFSEELRCLLSESYRLEFRFVIHQKYWNISV